MTSQRFSWSCEKASPYSVLPAVKIHSKSVKRGVVCSPISNAFPRSCVHQAGTSLQKAVQRLLKAGFSRDLVSSPALNIFGKSNDTTELSERRKNNWEVTRLLFFSQLTGCSQGIPGRGISLQWRQGFVSYTSTKYDVGCSKAHIN